jgi:hypothetical protein
MLSVAEGSEVFVSEVTQRETACPSNFHFRFSFSVKREETGLEARGRGGRGGRGGSEAVEDDVVVDAEVEDTGRRTEEIGAGAEAKARVE